MQVGNFFKIGKNVVAMEGEHAFNLPYIFRKIGGFEAKSGEIAPDIYKPNVFLERISD